MASNERLGYSTWEPQPDDDIWEIKQKCSLVSLEGGEKGYREFYYDKKDKNVYCWEILQKRYNFYGNSTDKYGKEILEKNKEKIRRAEMSFFQKLKECFC